MDSNQQAPNPTVYQQQPMYEDEISLVDIVNVLIRRKKLILGITALVVCIGLIYAFASKRIYEVETILLPPSYEDIQPLNVLNNKLDLDKVYLILINNLNSRKLRKEFYDKFKILDVISDGTNQIFSVKEKNYIFEGFSKSLKVKTEKKSDVTRVTLEGVNDEKLGEWLDSFIAMGNQETINQLVRNTDANLTLQIKNLEVTISSKRSIYKQKREDDLERLKEAFQTAKSLGIHEFNNTNSSPLKNNNLSIYLQNKKNYMQGTKVLQAEINALKNRRSDDIHISGLRNLQEKLIGLKLIKVDKNKIQTVFIDKQASVNIEPIRPKRRLILIISIVLGGMLGFFAAFIMEFISKFKSQTVNNA